MTRRPSAGAARAVVTALVAIVLVACSPAASGSPGPSASGAAPSSSAAAQAGCQPLDLLLPSGDPLDLSGSWVADDLGPYQFRQFGDCLWFVGQNATFSYVFFGRVALDLTVSGSWATISASDHLIGDVMNPGDTHIGSGTMVLSIDLGAGASNADVVLRKTSFANDPDFAPAYDVHVTTWTKVDDTPDHPFPLPSG